MSCKVFRSFLKNRSRELPNILHDCRRQWGAFVLDCFYERDFNPGWNPLEVSNFQFFLLFLQNSFKDASYFLHGCTGQWGTLLKPGSFLKRFWIRNHGGLSVKECFGGLISKIVLLWVHSCLLVVNNFLHHSKKFRVFKNIKGRYNTQKEGVTHTNGIKGSRLCEGSILNKNL